MTSYKCFSTWLVVALFLLLPLNLLGGDTVLLGEAYRGPKCVAGVGDFAVQVPGAPQEVGDGLREMLQTALFESNHFVVVDRMDMPGISAEQLLSDSFMANPDAILQQGKMQPAEVLVYGTLVSLSGGGGGLRVKIPWMPLSLGGTAYEAKTTVELRAVDVATGRILAVSTIDSSADSGKGSIGTTLKGVDMPVALEMFKNTPLELCIRDGIYRGVIKLCQDIPRDFFNQQE